MDCAPVWEFSYFPTVPSKSRVISFIFNVVVSFYSTTSFERMSLSLHFFSFEDTKASSCKDGFTVTVYFGEPTE